MNDIPYAIEYMRIVIDHMNDEKEGIMTWLAEIYQAIDDLRVDDIQQLIRGAKSFQLSPWGKAQVFLGRGDFHASLQEWEPAISNYQQGLSCLEDQENVENDQAILLNNLGLVYQEQARYEDALLSYEQAIQLYDVVNDRLAKIHTISNLASVYDARGDWEKAIHYYQQGIRELEFVDDKATLASFWNNLGVVCQNSGKQESAKEAYQQCIKILDEAGESQSAKGARILMNLGEIYAELKQTGRAVQSFQNAIQICHEIGDMGLEISVRNNIGTFYAKSGNFADAINCYETCLTLALQIGDRAAEALVLNNMGSAYEDGLSYDKAYQAYLQSLALAEENQELYGIARVRNNLGVLDEKQHRMDQALSHYTEAVRVLQEIGDYYREVTSIINIASLHAKLNEYNSSRKWIERGVSISKERQFMDHLAFLSILEGDIEFSQPDRFLEACSAYAKACNYACQLNAASLSKIMEIVLKRAGTMDFSKKKELSRHILDSCGNSISNSSEEFRQALAILSKDN